MPEMIKGGEIITSRMGGLTTKYYEITKEEYERITSKADYKRELEEAYKSTASDSILWGYGFYGCDVVMMQGKYWFSVCIGSSCD